MLCGNLGKSNSLAPAARRAEAVGTAAAIDVRDSMPTF
jgi:hypothetical protein